MKIIVITGPTATGKTALAVRLARIFNGEIISADSRQVYRGLDIGSGKDIAEYGEGGNRVPAHLLDIADPASGAPYSLADFMRDAKSAVAGISSRGKVPFICGGTALYIHALMKGYELHGGPADREFRDSLEGMDVSALVDMRGEGAPSSNCEKSNPYRLVRKLEIAAADPDAKAGAAGPIAGAEYLVIGSFRPREKVRELIEKRLDARLDSGMVDEVKALHEKHGVGWERLESFGLEYRELSMYLEGKVSFSEMRESLLTKIRRFAKRQDTWFRKMEREGIQIHWTEPENIEKASALCRAFLAGDPVPPPESQLAKNSRLPAKR